MRTFKQKAMIMPTFETTGGSSGGSSGGGGGSMETGELVGAYGHTHAKPIIIPVTAKHSHILIVPKVMSEHKATYAGKAQHALYAAENYGYIGASINNVADPGARGMGAGYWQDETQTTYGAEFTETTITVRCDNYASFGSNGATYAWFAW